MTVLMLMPGPVFRAERQANATRHLGEFYMLEAEVAFVGMDAVMDLAEGVTKQCIAAVLAHAAEDIIALDARCSFDLSGRLRAAVELPYARLSYTDAISALHAAGFVDAVWGKGLRARHERFLVEVRRARVWVSYTVSTHTIAPSAPRQHCGGPVFVMDYPAECKPFYMRRREQSEAPGTTVAAFDLLVSARVLCGICNGR